MSASPALAVEHLNAWYGAAQVLYDVTLTVGPRRGRGTDGEKRRRANRRP